MSVPVLVLALLTIFGQFGQPLELRAGAYEDLVIGVTDSVPASECRTILANLEEIIMSRGRKRKTVKGQFTANQMKNAVRQVIEENMVLREAAELNGLKFQTLARYVRKKRDNPTDEALRMKPKYDSRKIFSEIEEDSLCDYILQCTRMCYGKSTKDIRKLAYELAVANSKTIPDNWERDKKAGIDWFQSFMKRHQNLSIRQPEGCSLSRATSFNQHNVSLFFNNLQEVLQRSENLADPSRIFNLDETATTTVHKPKKIVAQRGMKQVSKCTSAERGTLVTTCCIINGAGNALPPIMIFPRKKFKQHMIFGAPPGTLGLANPSGWMTTELFVEVMKHFIKQSASSKENPSMLIMDNHESHISVATLNLAKDNGITIITLPPHCSNKLQPLDVTVFYSFKAFYNAAVDSWLLTHPGVPLNIYGIAGCVGQAFQRSMTPVNISSGFRKTGIFPFDRNVFTDEDFLLSKVTDRALVKPSDQVELNEGDPDDAGGSRIIETANNVAAVTSKVRPSSEVENSSRNGFISAEELKGFPQAKALTTGRKCRQKRKSAILTDTPEKSAIEAKELEKIRKKSAQNSTLKARKVKVSALLCSSDSSDGGEFMEQESGESEYEMEVEEQDFIFEPVQRKVEVNEFVLVEFSTKKKVYYIAKVTETQTDDILATLTSTSQHLFSSLDGRAFIQSATVVLPASWPDSCAPKAVTSGSGDTQDITILPEGPIRGRIWTQQSAGCGQSGDQIYLGYETLTIRDDSLARSLVKQFAMYRYGVFEEQGYENDPIHPTCYYDDESKRSKVTGCSDLPIKDNGICANPGASYNITQLVDEKARSSIMFAAEAPSVSMFCDEGTHDPYAPTKHNLICNKRSTFDIISNHPDFAINTIPSTHHTNEITNTTPRITYKKQNVTRYILIIENTKDMLQRESWNYLRTAIRKWALFDLPQNTEVGVLLAHETGATKMLNILSLRNSNARDMISSNIPYTSGDSSQPACLHCALKDAITMLDDQTKYRSSARNVIILIAPGMNLNDQLQNLAKEAKKAKIRIATINYPEVIRNQPLDDLALETDGVAYTVVEKKYNIDISMLSTYFQLTNVLYNIVERFYSGNPSNLPMEIHRRKLTDDGRTSVTGSFVLDDYMGEPARFMLYTHNTESPLIRGLSLVSPSHQEYVIRSDNMLSVKIISLAANITEPGTWTYTIERYAGNPQPHYIQVMATPHSRTVPVVRAKFWTRTNQPGGPLILLAEVKRGNWPVLGAKVEATFTRSEINGSVAYSDTLELLDTGSGDPDITKGDGIYTRYFSAAPGGPGTYTFEVIVTDNGNTAYTWHGTTTAPEEKPCCGSTIPTSSVQPLSPFQRVLPPITIDISSEDMVTASQVRVGRIGDLKVQVKPEDMKALLTWTSPDMGGTRAARYDIKYTTGLNDIVDNYETLAKRWEHATPHVLATGSETTVTLDMTKEKLLLDKALYFAIRAYPQMYSDALAAPISNWVRVLVPSPPPPPTVPPTFIPSDQTMWPNQIHSVGIDPVGPSLARNVNFGLEVILPIVVGVVILAIVLSLYCYFCVIKRRSRNNNKKPIKHSNGLKTDKLNSTVTIVPGSPLHSSPNSPQQGYVNQSDVVDHHTVGVPINNYSFDDEPKKRYSLVHQQEQQLIEELKQQQLQHQQQRELNTPNNTYAGLSVISNNSLQRNGHTLSPYNSWSASQLLHEHERRHSPLDNMMPEDQLLMQHQEMLMNGSQIDHMSLNGQNVDHISMNGHQIANQMPDHYNPAHAPPVPPLPVYNSNGYPVNYNIYGVHQPPQMVANQQNHPIYQSMQRNEPLGPYNASLQGSLSSVNSGEKKRRNVTMV